MDMITLNGSWARERAVERCRLHHGKQLVDSCRGESSHQNNPFVALCDNNADEDKGEVFTLETSMLRQKLLSIRKLVFLWV